MSMEDLYEYHLKYGGGTQHQINTFKTLVKKMFAYIFTVSKRYFYDTKIGQYHLFGCDFAIDKEFTPKIYECNTMPGTTSSYIKESRLNHRDSIWQSTDLMIQIFEKAEGSR